MTAVRRSRTRSALRDSQAAATRSAIVDAATRLFIERGYAATSVDAIAEGAGVGRATVFASAGGKPALLRLAYQASASAPAPAGSRPLEEEPDAPALLAHYGAIVTHVGGARAALYQAVRGAALADVETRSTWDAIQAERRARAGNFIDLLRSKGGLHEGLDRGTAIDVLLVLNDPGLYHQLVIERGWRVAKFEAWLRDALRDQLLPTGSGPEPAVVEDRAPHARRSIRG
jgi:AcrR family transcriptional regulator